MNFMNVSEPQCRYIIVALPLSIIEFLWEINLHLLLTRSCLQLCITYLKGETNEEQKRTKIIFFSRGIIGVFFMLTVIGIVSDDVVPSTPVPQQQGGVSGTGDNVAVPTDV